jgi:hypothetical protein
MSSNTYSKLINIKNVDNVRKDINRSKHGNLPTSNLVKEIITDYDTFPYPRWYRGQYNSSEPIIAEREAGYRPREDNCYRKNNFIVNVEYPTNCFESACSTVYPCYPEYLAKLSDRKAMNVLLNKNCISPHR